jgi:hypothetical protein
MMGFLALWKDGYVGIQVVLILHFVGLYARVHSMNSLDTSMVTKQEYVVSPTLVKHGT